eukprot:gnl/TRDRNA2_/TRDRNA2_156114_c0_seq2.p1 gnl/TRDRNA2_/TRDRNA2_156114_c0~~gnl/TRDRNA2_/TRDRNA2_156114_c0_seq2.p1  ORF type:complete len:332 (-),score=50.26 gnl/TRDRNA2_/TRDRNA2_156114_c0_seq2:67-1062(-)
MSLGGAELLDDTMLGKAAHTISFHTSRGCTVPLSRSSPLACASARHTPKSLRSDIPQETDVGVQGRVQRFGTGSDVARRVAFSGLGLLITTVGAQLPSRAYGRGDDDVERRVMKKIYSFVGIETKNGWADENDDLLSTFRSESSPTINPFTYGEITSQGIDSLAETLGLRDNPTETFYDLGSGAGRAVLHMCARGYVRGECHGIEFSKVRVDASEALKAEAVSVAGGGNLGKRLASRVSFKQGDLRDEDFSDATLIWTSNLCFPEEVNKAMAQKILSYPKVQTVASLLALPGLEEADFELTEVFLRQTFDSEVNGGTSDVYLYRRKQGGGN